MSRRCHHGSPRHARSIGRERPRGPVVADRPATQPGASAPDPASREEPVSGLPYRAELREASGDREAAAVVPARAEIADAGDPSAREVVDQDPSPRARMALEAVALPAPPHAPAAHQAPPIEPGVPGDHGATAPQLRRFIKSRAYVPMHELRRRFAINGDDDDVTILEVDRQRVYVGLPEREGRLLGDLLRGGDIGVELSLDPIAPIVVGVYPMRPIPRT